LGPFWAQIWAPLGPIFGPSGRRPEKGSLGKVKSPEPAGRAQGAPQKGPKKGHFWPVLEALGPLRGPKAEREGENEGPEPGRAGAPKRGPKTGPRGGGDRAREQALT